MRDLSIAVFCQIFAMGPLLTPHSGRAKSSTIFPLGALPPCGSKDGPRLEVFRPLRLEEKETPKFTGVWGSSSPDSPFELTQEHCKTT